MALDPHHLACLEAALDLALESPRGPDGALTPEGKAHVKAALDQAEHDGPLHHWESMSEADWACFAASDWQPYTVTRGKNKGKQAWKHVKSGRISYEDPAAKEKERAGKEAAKARAKQEAAAKAKAAVKAKADAAAKKKAEAEAKRKAAEAAKAKAAAAKEAAAKKVQQQRQQAAQHIRDVVSGGATTTPAKVRAAGAHLLSMTATELRALKSEIGAKGGGAAKAGLVAAITERALAARKAGKGKAAPAKPAKPVAKPKPGKEAGADLTAAVPDNPLLRAMVAIEPQDFEHGALIGIKDLRAAMPGVPKEQLDRALLDLVERGVLIPHRHDFPDDPEKTALQGGKQGLVADGKGNYLVGFALDGRTPEGKAFGAAADPKFTGTDALGRKWINGELVAKEEKPAVKGAKPPAPPATTSAPADPMAGHPLAGKSREEMVRDVQRDVHPTAGTNPRRYDPAGYPPGVDGPRLARAVGEVVAAASAKNPFDATPILDLYTKTRAGHPGLTLQQFQASLVKMAKDGLINLRPYTQSLMALSPQQLASVIPLDMDAKFYVRPGPKAGAPAGPAAATDSLPADQQAALEKRKFTGTDRLGRKWVNGKLVAKEEGPAPGSPATPAPTSTADALRELQDARASTHHLPHQSMSLAELRDRLGLTDPQALDLARRLRQEQGVTAETRSGDLLGQNGVGDVVIPLQGVQPRHKAPATAEQVEAAVPKVEAAVREAAAALPPGGQVKISDLRRQLGLGRHEFDSAMHALRRAGKVKLDAISNLQRAKPGELADAIPGVNETLFYVEPVGSDAPGIPKPSPGGKGPDGHQEFEARDGSKVQAPFYDQHKVPADFAIPGKPGLLGDAVTASEELRRKNYGVLNTADLYDALRAKHPDLDLHDFHRQLFAWQHQDLMVTQTTNDPEVLTPDQVAKSPAVKDMRGVPVLRGQLRFSAKGQEAR